MNIIPAKLRQEWHWVRPGLEKIIARNKCHYRPEDIYHRCLCGELSFYIDEQREAFCFLRSISRHTTGEIGVYIAALHAQPGTATDAALAALSDLARATGATYLEMGSQRVGFARTGWDIEYTVYSRSL